MLGQMRVVFIFVVLLVVLCLAAPTTFAIHYWLDGKATIARANQSGALGLAPAGRLNTVEYTVAMSEFRETWGTRAQPCRTIAYLWTDLTGQTTPTSMPVSQRVATAVIGERRGTSVRWQVQRIIVACQLEQIYDDRQLLRLLLRGANFGQEPLGIDAAAQAYFAKPSSTLNRAESARLAALLRAPSLRNQPERWTERARLIEERVAAAAQ
jgi:hypothetical protein